MKKAIVLLALAIIGSNANASYIKCSAGESHVQAEVVEVEGNIALQRYHEAPILVSPRTAEAVVSTLRNLQGGSIQGCMKIDGQTVIVTVAQNGMLRSAPIR